MYLICILFETWPVLSVFLCMYVVFYPFNLNSCKNDGLASHNQISGTYLCDGNPIVSFVNSANRMQHYKTVNVFFFQRPLKMILQG
jgi:hypothetical protein